MEKIKEVADAVRCLENSTKTYGNELLELKSKVQQLERRTPQILCKTCRFFALAKKYNSFFGKPTTNSYEFGTCERTRKNRVYKPDLLRNEPEILSDATWASHERSKLYEYEQKDSRCGPDAQFWEPIKP